MSSNRLQDLVDNYLLEEQTKEQAQENDHKFHPSRFGRCFRYQIWARSGERPSNPIGVQTLRIFRAGDLFHDFVQKLLPQDYQSEVEINTDDINGHADIVCSNEVMDIKSIRSFGMKAMKKEGYDITKDKLSYILQVVSYALFLHKPKARLVFIDKDNLEIAEYEFIVAQWEQKVADEIGTLRFYWKSPDLPPAQPRAYNGKECDYCVYKDKCVAKEQPFLKEVKDNKYVGKKKFVSSKDVGKE